MQSNFLIWVTSLALFAFPSTADSKSITYDCDTAADHFSQLILPTSGVPFTVSGNVQLIRDAGSENYVPSARVKIASPDEPDHSPQVYVGFALSALSVGAKMLPTGAPAIQMLSYIANGKDNEGVPLSILTKPGTIQPFKLSFDGSYVSVSLGTASKSFPMKTADPVVRLVCSTGEFLFTDLTITPLQ